MRRSAAVYHKFTEDEIRQANSVDILSLARGYGYEPEKAGRKAVHMKHSGGLYIFPENNRFFQWTGPDDGIKGGAIDFVMREEYVPGTKVVLDEAVIDPCYDAPAGLAGIVQSVDDAGQLLCQWENGLSFRLVPGTDHFHKEAVQELELPDEEEADLEL